MKEERHKDLEQLRFFVAHFKDETATFYHCWQDSEIESTSHATSWSLNNVVAMMMFTKHHSFAERRSSTCVFFDPLKGVCAGLWLGFTAGIWLQTPGPWNIFCLSKITISHRNEMDRQTLSSLCFTNTLPPQTVQVECFWMCSGTGASKYCLERACHETSHGYSS